MGKIIDSDILLPWLWDYISDQDYEKVKKVIEEMPSAERTGHWEQIANNDNGIDFRCSACHRYRFHNGEMRKKYKYCPNCGTKMEESE